MERGRQAERLFARWELFVVATLALFLLGALFLLRYARLIETGNLFTLLGSAFGTSLAIYGAQKVARIKEIRERKEAREDLADAALAVQEAADWTLLNHLRGKGATIHDCKRAQIWIATDLSVSLNALTAISSQAYRGDSYAKREFSHLRAVLEKLKTQLGLPSPKDDWEAASIMMGLDELLGQVSSSAWSVQNALRDNQLPWQHPDKWLVGSELRSKPYEQYVKDPNWLDG